MSTGVERIGVGRVFDVEWSRTTAVLCAMLLLDAVWWWLVLTGHVPMPGRGWLAAAEIPMTAPGAMALATVRTGTLDALFGYVVTWGVMMWAMMYPAMTRFTRDYAAALRGRPVAVAGGVAGFLVGYNAVWAAAAAIPLGLQALLPGGIYGFVTANPTTAVGTALVVTGGYQFTQFKQSHLRSCCATVTPRQVSLGRSLRDGATHGANCVVVSLAFFFVLMPVLGAMNPFWMVALTLPVTLERLPTTWGSELSAALGAVTVAAGVGVFVLPTALG